MSVRTSRVAAVTVLEMAHGKANAFDIVFLRALREAVTRALDSDARALVLTATGTIFSAGVDLPRLLDGDDQYVETFMIELSDAFQELFAARKPVVAAVNGHAIAGGAILALSCDYRLMTRGVARIGVPELRVGVPFPMVPAEICRYALGARSAQRAMLAGHVVEAAAAVDEGYADELVEPERLRERALEMAEAMAAVPLEAFARTKSDLHRPVVETWKRLGARHERETLELWRSPAVRDAIRRHVERVLNKTRQT